MFDLRPWQQRARRLVAEIVRDTPPDQNTILLEAGIGSGKTLAALISAKDAIDSKLAARIIVVTFTSHLVRQWGKIATAVGLNLLECRTGNGVLKEGFPIDANGYIATFAAVASLSTLHETFTTGVRTIVIIDEIHHLGEDYDDAESSNPSEMTQWAEEAYNAFKNALMVLALSGTPYRTDKKQIPFVEYEADPVKDLYKLKSDIQYTYGQSVFDGICRRVVFETLDGPIDMNVSFEKNGIITSPPRNETLRFADKVDPDRYYDRLVAALIIDNEYSPLKSKNQLLIELIRKATNKLHDLRQTEPRAGGLIIAGTKESARKLRTLIKQMTGHDAILVLEDVEKASDLIAAFVDGDSPWIIAVNMVAEGVDIPRLRVCLYLSAKTAWLYVMQVIGRIVRDPPGQSYFFCFPDPRINKIIAQIEEELEIWLRKKKDGLGPPTPEFKKIIELNKALGDEWAGMVAGEPITAAEMTAVETMRHAMPELTDSDYLVLVQIARKTSAEKQQQARTRTPSSDPGMSYTEIRLRLRQDIQRGVGRLNKLRPDWAHNDIHAALNRDVGVRGKNSASQEQLEHMLALIREWIAVAERNGNDNQQS
jgi:superfamily II DNA or RNA helicase